jgi:hypothetical protein
LQRKTNILVIDADEQLPEIPVHHQNGKRDGIGCRTEYWNHLINCTIIHPKNRCEIIGEIEFPMLNSPRKFRKP